MKKFLLSTFLVILGFCIAFNSVDAYVSVKGYTRKDGTYVAPYVRSNPNGLKYDNYGYKPSQGLYNSTYGTRGTIWDTPTYTTDPDYYIGKSLYENNSSGVKLNSNPVKTSVKVLSSINLPYSAKLWADNNPTSACDQSTFLRQTEKNWCNFYRNNKNSYNWNVTTVEYDNKHYRYDSNTQTSYSCGDGYVFVYDSNSGIATGCIQEV